MIPEKLPTTRIKAFVALVIGLAAVVGTLYGSVRFNGIVNTLIYTVVFVVCLTFLPTIIGIAGAGVPGSTALGKAHIVLGAFAFREHFLVERADRWELCPGDGERVYIDDEWHDIEGGLEYKSVLGWRPFGIIPYKSDETWANVRVDNKAVNERSGAATDGGAIDEAEERAGWSLRDQPTVTGKGSTWLLDIKRIYSSGIRDIGDIDLIETAEEIIERKQVNDPTISDNPTVTFFVAMILGIIIGGVVLYLG